MSREKDIAGQRFGSLVAIRRVPSESSHIVWLFRCDCGAESAMFKQNVTRGHILTCVACGHDRQRKAVVKHGHCVSARKGRQSPEYGIYSVAKHRCTNPNNPRYADYGGRGIRFRFASFEEFYAHIGPRPEGRNITLDRIDNEGHYEPGNVAWVPMKLNASHRRPRRIR